MSDFFPTGKIDNSIADSFKQSSQSGGAVTISQADTWVPIPSTVVKIDKAGLYLVTIEGRNYASNGTTSAMRYIGFGYSNESGGTYTAIFNLYGFDGIDIRMRGSTLAYLDANSYIVVGGYTKGDITNNKFSNGRIMLVRLGDV